MISVLAYKSKDTIAHCIASARNLSFEGTLEIRIREQGGDNEEFTLLQNIADGDPRITLTRGENLGFAKGHNLQIRESGTDFILCLNADALLKEDFLEHALPAFQDARVGAVQGKLLRWDTAHNAPATHPGSKRPVIDTTGLLPLRNRRIINRGQGEEDNGQYNAQEEIFGADGAAPVYRREALEDVTIPFSVFAAAQSTNASPPNQDEPTSPETPSQDEPTSPSQGGQIGEYFDEDFFVYKEDVDLAWRMQWRGWKTMYVPEAIGFHARGSGESAARNPFAVLKERRKLSGLSKYYSFGNQRLMQIKNERIGALLKDVLPWSAKEVGAWGVALLTEKKTVPAIARMLQLMPRALKKRRFIQSRRKDEANPYQWFS